jgi:hypothetical protein
MFQRLKTMSVVVALGAMTLAQNQALPNPPPRSSDIAVVVNAKNPTVRLSMADLRKIFAGQTRTWPSRIPIQLIIRAPEAHEHEAVLHLLRLSEPEFKHYWDSPAYWNEPADPVAVFSNGMQKEAVMSFPGAIALMAAEDVKPGLKVLKIDDNLPGEKGYPLQ